MLDNALVLNWMRKSRMREIFFDSSPSAARVSNV
jgi:hypothetical protein